MIIGFNNGDVNKNVMIGPNDALAFNNPKVNGIVEQLQNGVTDPNPDAIKYPPLFDDKTFCTFVGFYKKIYNLH